MSSNRKNRKDNDGVNLQTAESAIKCKRELRNRLIDFIDEAIHFKLAILPIRIIGAGQSSNHTIGTRNSVKRQKISESQQIEQQSQSSQLAELKVDIERYVTQICFQIFRRQKRNIITVFGGNSLDANDDDDDDDNEDEDEIISADHSLTLDESSLAAEKASSSKFVLTASEYESFREQIFSESKLSIIRETGPLIDSIIDYIIEQLTTKSSSTSTSTSTFKNFDLNNLILKSSELSKSVLPNPDSLSGNKQPQPTIIVIDSSEDEDNSSNSDPLVSSEEIAGPIIETIEPIGPEYELARKRYLERFQQQQKQHLNLSIRKPRRQNTRLYSTRSSSSLLLPSSPSPSSPSPSSSSSSPKKSYSILRSSSESPATTSRTKTTNNMNINYYTDNLRMNKCMKIIAIDCLAQSCPETFADKSKRDNHMLAAHRTFAYRCLQDGCAESFSTSVKFAAHIKAEHADVSVWRCAQCTRRFATAKALTDHFRYHHEMGLFRCSHHYISGEDSPSEPKPNVDYNRPNNSTPENSIIRCCDFEADTRHEVLRHYRREHIRIACGVEQCAFVCNDGPNLRRHRTLVHGIRPQDYAAYFS